MVAVVYFDEADAAWDRKALFSFNNIETSLSGALVCIRYLMPLSYLIGSRSHLQYYFIQSSVQIFVAGES